MTDYRITNFLSTENKNINKKSLCTFPTPITKLDTISNELGLNLFFKRDDLTGLGIGGNKLRKLEYLLADAISVGATHIITLGGIQSNHCAQTALASKKLGLDCTVIIAGKAPKKEDYSGNLKLYQLLGTNVCIVPDFPDRQPKAEQLISELESKNEKPYLVPVGGLTDIGALGYINAMGELSEQIKSSGQNYDYIVVPTGSGGTLSGIVPGKELFSINSEIIGVAIEPSDEMVPDHVNEFTKIANNALKRISSDIMVNPEDFNIDFNVAYDYAVMRELELSTIKQVAQKEAIFLDPVYTSRAFAGFLNLVKKGKFEIGSSVLFWFTGGAGAIFADKYKF